MESYYNDGGDCIAYPETTNLILSGGQTVSADSYGFAVSRSTDGGQNWTRRRMAYPRRGYCKSLSVRPPNRGGEVYAAGWIQYPTGVAGAVFRSTDRGATWESLPTSPPDTVIDVLADHQFSGRRVWCATTSGLYLTTDEGLTWSRSIPTRGMRAIDCAEASNMYAAAGDSGAWQSTDWGSNWFKCDSGLGGTRVTALEYLWFEDTWLYVLAGTWGGSVYVYSWDVGVAEQPRSAARPPTAASVCRSRLAVEMERPGEVRLVDVSGRVVLSRRLARGRGELDVSGLAAGVYQLMRDGAGETQRVVIGR
jgi:photosystem II stability/assembly factor-like uncharacterized protein